MSVIDVSVFLECSRGMTESCLHICFVSPCPPPPVWGENWCWEIPISSDCWFLFVVVEVVVCSWVCAFSLLILICLGLFIPCFFGGWWWLRSVGCNFPSSTVCSAAFVDHPRKRDGNCNHKEICLCWQTLFDDHPDCFQNPRRFVKYSFLLSLRTTWYHFLRWSVYEGSP